MTANEALDTIFSFIPTNVLKIFKKKGFYDPILSGKISSSADIYAHLNSAQAIWQDTNYSNLGNILTKHLRPGSILEIGCGSGNLIKKLTQAKFKPIYGLDHSRAMIRLAQKKLRDYEQVYLILEKIENYDFQKMTGIDNIIINNFWGLLPKRNSIKLLLDIKLHLKGKLIIGPFYQETPIKIRLAAEYLEKNLHFHHYYPLFTNFKQLGYKEKIINVGEAQYYILSSNI
ncbi:MAG: class I SAM-dependent methyltransferase [Patescibacteria group bacterium]|jgi:SAM-dependent methyltransferase